MGGGTSSNKRAKSYEPLEEPRAPAAAVEERKDPPAREPQKEETPVAATPAPAPAAAEVPQPAPAPAPAPAQAPSPAPRREPAQPAPAQAGAAPRAKEEAPAKEPPAPFSARLQNVIDWEAIHGPAQRKALPMLVELERTQRCDHWLWRPIHYAALHGMAHAMQPLLSVGALIDARTGGHAPAGKPLSKAAFNFYAEVATMVGGRQESVHVEEVTGDHMLVLQPHTNQRMRVLVESCVCTGFTQVQHSTHTRHFGYATALHIAVEYQHVETVKVLLSLRADPNTSWNDERDRPLHTAITQGQTEVVCALLQHKADPCTESCWGHTPLATAALCPKQPSRVVAMMLLEAGAKRGSVDLSGKTAAQLARELGHDAFADTIEMYQTTGADIAAVYAESKKGVVQGLAVTGDIRYTGTEKGPLFEDPSMHRGYLGAGGGFTMS